MASGGATTPDSSAQSTNFTSWFFTDSPTNHFFQIGFTEVTKCYNNTSLSWWRLNVDLVKELIPHSSPFRRGSVIQ